MRRPLTFLALVALVAGAVPSWIDAQIDGSRGVAPVGGGGAFEVSGIAVDVVAANAEAARFGGWRLAQRKAWVQLSRRLGAGGALVSDGTLDQLVSGIVVENEQIGPTRYIARLGVTFDRPRAAALLGVSAYAERSPPMLVVPLVWSTGVGTVFEQRSDWQQAWARFRTSSSSVDYIRPAGSGPDSLLLTAGQVARPGRGWWRTILAQYGASDVLIPTVRLYRQWPGGPVIGVFQARHGPDNELVGGFSLRVGSADGLAQLLDTGVARIDAIYAQALRDGRLAPDIALSPPPSPEAPVAEETPDLIGDIIDGITPLVPGAATVTLQYDTPGTSSVANVEALIRGIPGVRSAATTSLALGGLSLMRVEVDDQAAFAAALRARGYQVLGTGTTLRLRRAPQLVPDLPPDSQTAG